MTRIVSADQRTPGSRDRKEAPTAVNAIASMRFSTADLPVRDRTAAWCEHFGRAVLGLAFEPSKDAPFQGGVTLIGIPGLHIASGFVSSALHQRTRQLRADGNSDLYLVTVCRSAGIASELGREMEFSDGDAFLLSAADDYTLYSPGTARICSLRLPRSALSPLIPDIDDAVMRPIDRNTEALRLLFDYIALLKRGRTLSSHELRHLAATHVHDLVALALGASRDAAHVASRRGLRAARLEAILRAIGAGFDDPAFSPVHVAKNLGLSPRYIRDLLQETGHGFSERVLELRLNKARSMLTSPAHGGCKIIDIAYACGFNEVSYFNRCFRLRYGAPPSDVRAEAHRE